MRETINITVIFLLVIFCLGVHATTAPLAQSCYDLICHDTVDINASLTKDSSAIDETEFSKIQGLITNLYNANQSDFEDTVSKLHLLDLSQVQVSDEVGDLALVIYSVNRMSENLQFVSFSGGYLKFDIDSYLKQQVGGSGLIDASIAAIIEKILNQNDYFRALMAGLDWNDVIQTLLQSRDYPGFDKKALTHSIVASSDSYQARVAADLGQPYHQSIEFKKVLASQELTTTEQASLLVQVAGSDVIRNVLYGQLKGIFKSSGFATSPLYRKIMSTPLDSLVRLTTSANSAKMTSCLKNTRLTIQNALTSQESEQLQQNVTQVRFFSKQVVQSFVKTPDKVSLALSQIDAVQFKLPDDRENIQKTLEQDFTDQINGLNSVKSPEILWGTYLNRAADYLAMSSSLKPQAFDNTCADYMPQVLTDHERSSLSNISLSVASGKDSRLGIGLAAHEMGHVVFHALTGGDTTPTDLSIVGANAVVLNCELGRLSGKGLYLNEEFADAFSAHVERLMANANPQYATNMGCSLTQYLGSSIDTVNPNPNDPHPANFFRALVFAQDLQGSLPKACQDYLAEQKLPSLNSCY